MFTKNLKQILSSFEKTIADLESLITRNSVRVDENNEIVRQCQQETGQLICQSQHARDVADKLRDLIGKG